MAPRPPRALRRPLELAGKATMFATGSRTLSSTEPLDRVLGRDALPRAVRGRVVLVTGASSGIGRATARRLGGAGAIVLLVARREDELEVVRGKIADDGGVAHVLPCDLTDLDAVDALAQQALAEHGTVDVLVNNAGRSIRRSVDLSYDRFHDYERTMQLNYFAPVRLILALLPAMRTAGRGQVVNISSAGVQALPPRFAAYLASKAALDAFSTTVGGEVRSDGVLFTAVHMPLVRTPMIAPTGAYRAQPALAPREAAELVARAIAYRQRRVGPVYGQLAQVAEAISPEAMAVLRSGGYELTRDSRAARGPGD